MPLFTSLAAVATAMARGVEKRRSAATGASGSSARPPIINSAATSARVEKTTSSTVLESHAEPTPPRAAAMKMLTPITQTRGMDTNLKRRCTSPPATLPTRLCTMVRPATVRISSAWRPNSGGPNSNKGAMTMPPPMPKSPESTPLSAPMAAMTMKSSTASTHGYAGFTGGQLTDYGRRGYAAGAQRRNQSRCLVSRQGQQQAARGLWIEEQLLLVDAQAAGQL